MVHSQWYWQGRWMACRRCTPCTISPSYRWVRGHAGLPLHMGVVLLLTQGYRPLLATVYAGMVVVRTGAVMSHTAEFHIVVTGTGGHGGLPAVGTDALTAAAHVVVAMQVRRARYGCYRGAHNLCWLSLLAQSVVSRSVAASESAVLSVCNIHGGESCNVIPSEVRLGGTIRDVDPEVFSTVCRRMREVVNGVRSLALTQQRFVLRSFERAARVCLTALSSTDGGRGCRCVRHLV